MTRRVFCLLLVVSAVAACASGEPTMVELLLESAAQPGITLNISGECGAYFTEGTTVEINVAVSRTGYLYLIDFDGDPDFVVKFFPSDAYGVDNVVTAEGQLVIPSSDSEGTLTMGPPYADGLVLAILVPEPIDFRTLVPALAEHELTDRDSWSLTGPGVEIWLAEVLVEYLRDLPEDAGYSLAYCSYTVVPPEETRGILGIGTQEMLVP